MNAQSRNQCRPAATSRRDRGQAASVTERRLPKLYGAGCVEVLSCKFGKHLGRYLHSTYSVSCVRLICPLSKSARKVILTPIFSCKPECRVRNKKAKPSSRNVVAPRRGESCQIILRTVFNEPLRGIRTARFTPKLSTPPQSIYSTHIHDFYSLMIWDSASWFRATVPTGATATSVSAASSAPSNQLALASNGWSANENPLSGYFLVDVPMLAFPATTDLPKR